MGRRVRNSWFVCFNNTQRVKKSTCPPGLSTSPSRKKERSTHAPARKILRESFQVFSEIFKFSPRIPDIRNVGKLKLCQDAKRRFGNAARRALSLPTRYPRPPDRTGTHPGQPRPLTAAPHSTTSPPSSTRGPPTSATQTPLPYNPLPLTALTLGVAPPPQADV